MKQILKEYHFADMVVRYEIDEERNTGLLIYPADLPVPDHIEKKAVVDQLVQLKIAGDIYRGAYAPGNSMREGESSKKLKYKEQFVREILESKETEITTVLCDDRGIQAEHTLIWREGTPYLKTYTTLKNNSDKSIKIEMLSSFSLQGISPYLEGDGREHMMAHRLRSRWSEEGILESQTMEELQLNPSWGLAGVRSERYGSIGSMPVNHYFPFGALEDTRTHVFWGAQLMIPSSWQMEFYREDENIAFSGGIADREFGHWMKSLETGETFSTPEAIVSCAHTECIDKFTSRLTSVGKENRKERPASENSLPMIFNEYCTTWGDPSEENIAEILQAIRGKDFSYFVIDCGWYRQTGVPWDVSMGDYEVSKELFSHGLDKTVAAIKDAGMVPGIWFEIENVGPASKAYNLTEHLLKRDGEPLTTTRRRFWDLKDSWVQDYLDERVIGTLKKYGFGYIKVDYNDEIGIGCDGGDSFGDALYENMQESYHYFEKMKEKIPYLIIENCASGGHRLEPGFMARSSMASFSDAHECKEIPIVAANLHRSILPEQSQIWAVIREKDSLKRIAYSVINTFLGRMCISGDVTHLTGEQWKILDDGMAFYKEIAPIIRDGQSYIWQKNIRFMHHPEGYQVVLRVGENGKAFLTIHVFGGTLPEMIRVKLPEGTPMFVEKVFSDTDEVVLVKDGILEYTPKENDKALAVILKKKAEVLLR